MPANDKTGQPANDNGPCSTPVLAGQEIGRIKPPAILATAATANDNGVNTAVHRDSGSDRRTPPSVRHKIVAITRSAALSCVRPIPRRGLSRDEAAMYIGISATKFDELVRDGRMPGPKRIDARKVWDVRDLDVAFDALPSENPASQESTWDDFRAP